MDTLQPYLILEKPVVSYLLQNSLSFIATHSYDLIQILRIAIFLKDILQLNSCPFALGTARIFLSNPAHRLCNVINWTPCSFKRESCDRVVTPLSIQLSGSFPVCTFHSLINSGCMVLSLDTK